MMMNTVEYTLDYQELLFLLAQALGPDNLIINYKNKSITFREFYSYLQEVQSFVAKSGVMLTIPSRKVVSNELARLYRMGFLSRKAVPRKVKTKSGKIANRGIEYRYSFTKQGIKYLSYLAKNGSGNMPVVLEPEVEAFISKMREEGMIKSYEDELIGRKLTKLIWGTSFKDKDDGKLKIFTPKGWSPANKKMLKILEKKEFGHNTTIKQVYKYRDDNKKLEERIKELEDELEKKTKEIEKLKLKLKRCEKNIESRSFNLEKSKITPQVNYSVSLNKKPVKNDETDKDLKNMLKRLEKDQIKHTEDAAKEIETHINIKIPYGVNPQEMVSIIWAYESFSTLSLEIKKSGIIIRWVKPPNLGEEIEYVIFKNGKEYARVPADMESYLDKNVEEGESYEYHIRAIGRNLYSDSPKIQVTYKKENESVVYTPFGSHHSIEWSIHHPEDLDV